jgi:hypothetical protein
MDFWLRASLGPGMSNEINGGPRCGAQYSARHIRHIVVFNSARHILVFGLRFACRIRYRLEGDRRGRGSPGDFLFDQTGAKRATLRSQQSPKDLTPCVARSAVRACCCAGSAK